MYQGFHPSGIGANVICATTYRDAEAVGNDVIDDYKSEPDLDRSSSGGMVTFDVNNAFEARENDANAAFTWMASDPMNGMTQASTSIDFSAGVVFDYSPGNNYFYEYEIVEALQDFNDDVYLSFRVCQGTRHPETNSLFGTLNFTVTLEDLDGVASSINFGNYGNITHPYRRAGLGSGLGWANEFTTVRIRIADFENDGSGIDLESIAFLRFELGENFGSERGRIGIDTVHLTQD